MSKNRIHLEMEWSRTEHTLNRAAWLCFDVPSYQPYDLGLT